VFSGIRGLYQESKEAALSITEVVAFGALLFVAAFFTIALILISTVLAFLYHLLMSGSFTKAGRRVKESFSNY